MNRGGASANHLPVADSCPRRFIFVYGMLIYRQLGAQAEESFSRSFGISWAMNQVTEWQDVAKEALKAAVVMAILERLYLSPNAQWLEQHIDYLSVQAIVAERGLSMWGRIRIHSRFSRRLAADE